MENPILSGIRAICPNARPTNVMPPGRSEINMNPNSLSSRMMREAFNCLQPEIHLEICKKDKDGIYVKSWSKRPEKPKPDFTFIERKKGQGFCVGGYMSVELLEEYKIFSGQKCLVENKTTMSNRGLLLIRLGSCSKTLTANRDIPIVSFDPTNKK